MFGISDFDDKKIEKAIAQKLNDATQFMEFKKLARFRRIEANNMA